MLYEDRCIIPLVIVIQTWGCSLGINIADVCTILLVDARVILATYVWTAGVVCPTIYGAWELILSTQHLECMYTLLEVSVHVYTHITWTVHFKGHHMGITNSSIWFQNVKLLPCVKTGVFLLKRKHAWWPLMAIVEIMATIANWYGPFPPFLNNDVIRKV